MTSNIKSPQAQTSLLAAETEYMKNLSLNNDETAEELEKFRSEWRREVESRRVNGHGGGEIPVGNVRWKEDKKASVVVENKVVKSKEAVAVTSPVKSTKGLVTDPALDARSQNGDHDEEQPRKEISYGKTDAVTLYSRAVESEQAGKLHEALIMYRKAFKLDDNVDRLYARWIAKQPKEDPTLPEIPSSKDIVSSSAPVEEPYSFQRHIQMAPDYEKQNHPSVLPPSSSSHTTTYASNSNNASIISTRRSPLTTLLQNLPTPADQTSFFPANENLPIPISLLPSELIDPILPHLSVADIERFGQTCWRARYLTATSNFWKRIVEGIYKPPVMVPLGLSSRELVKRHLGEWRTTLVEEERVRMDGCYISICHYIRPGSGDQWVTITHLITYHRFLRFYPDGRVISYLTTEHPSEVVPILRPSLRGKGLHIGRWRLLRSDHPTSTTTSNPSDNTKKSGGVGSTGARIIITDLLEPGIDSPKYEFEMNLTLRETGRGRWNKLDITNYNSINLETGESLGLSLKHQKPFYFSKVKSYHPQL